MAAMVPFFAHTQSLPSEGRLTARFRLGQRVLFEAQGGLELCTIRFVGCTTFAEGEWVGLELDRRVGKNDGSVRGTSYFRCAPLHGIFCRHGRVRPQLTHLQRPLQSKRRRNCSEGPPRLEREQLQATIRAHTPAGRCQQRRKDADQHTLAGSARLLGSDAGQPAGAVAGTARRRQGSSSHRARWSAADQASSPTKEVLDHLWSLADVDGDGVLSLDEFRRLMHSVREEMDESAVVETFETVRRAYDDAIVLQAALPPQRQLPLCQPKGVDFSLYRELLFSDLGLHVSGSQAAEAIARLEADPPRSSSLLPVAEKAASDAASDCDTVVTTRDATTSECGTVPSAGPGSDAGTLRGDEGSDTDEDMPELEAVQPQPFDESAESVETLEACLRLVSDDDVSEPPGMSEGCGGDFSKCWGRKDLGALLKGM